MKFPYVKQIDSKQCGAACLSSICRYYGKKCSSQHISRFCTARADGVSMLSLSRAAQRLGFDTMCVSIPLEKLFQCDLPAVLHWNQNHYVVLYKTDRKKGLFYVCDPGKGLIRFDKAEFTKHWLGESEKGIAMMLEPTAEFATVNDEHERGLSSYTIVLNYIRKYRSYLLQIFLGLLFACALQLVLPFLTQTIVDVGIREKQIHLIWLVLAGELLIVVGKTLADFIRRWLLLHITMRVNATLVSDFFIKLMSLPMSFFESKTIGDLTQRISDHNRVQSFLTNQFLGSAFSVLTLLVFSVVLFMYSRIIFLVFAIGSILYAAWIVTFLRRRKVIDYELFEVEAVNQSKTYQMLNSMQEIKLQDCRKRRRWEWEDTQADLFTVQQKSLKLQQTQEAGAVFINEIKNIFITVLSATFVIDGNLTLGGMMAIQYIIGQLTSPVEQLTGVAYSFQDMRISLERINEVHNSTREKDLQGNVSELKEPRGIEFTNVCFKYDEYSPLYTLRDVTFRIPKGKVTAIVGASGSGKTTLVKLMLGYYPCLSGDITIDGTSIRDYDLDWWRRQCGVVMQDGYVFSESIARNIAVDDNEIDWERLRYACRIANIEEYINRLPLKYETIIGHEGTGLSQGQKQRILIARAVYKNPSYIFLDEATNSLDATNERIIVENLSRYYEGKTVTIVAHRLSTVKNADQIIVVENGKITEIGTHDELIAKAGAYYNLIKNQLELGK